MRPHHFWIAGIGILAMLCLFPVVPSGAAPVSHEKVIYSFQGGNDGFWPFSDLTLDSSGNLYGTTYYGGGASCPYGCGTVFELKRSPDGWKKQTLHEFNFGDGGFPAAGVIFDAAGSLYGTTSGGNELCGNVFKLAPNLQGNWTESVLYTFTCGNDGRYPQTDLVFDARGDLFGTTSGSVFELVPQSNGSWKEVTIHTFTGAPDGAVPSSAVVLDASGNVWGTTMSGGTKRCEFYLTGAFGCGVVYRLAPGSGGKWTETVVYDFARGDGRAVSPSNGFLLESAGHLFGTTFAGGNGIGAFFELKQSRKGWEQQVLYRFYGDPDGDTPVGKLTTDGAGALFGATVRGGKDGSGTVFALDRSTGGWRETVLHSFVYGSSNDGYRPQAGVVSDSRGHLYGTTEQGGGSGCQGSGGIGCGTVYEITLSSQER